MNIKQRFILASDILIIICIIIVGGIVLKNYSSAYNVIDGGGGTTTTTSGGGTTTTTSGGGTTTTTGNPCMDVLCPEGWYCKNGTCVRGTTTTTGGGTTTTTGGGTTTTTGGGTTTTTGGGTTTTTGGGTTTTTGGGTTTTTGGGGSEKIDCIKFPDCCRSFMINDELITVAISKAKYDELTTLGTNMDTWFNDEAYKAYHDAQKSKEKTKTISVSSTDITTLFSAGQEAWEKLGCEPYDPHCKVIIHTPKGDYIYGQTDRSDYLDKSTSTRDDIILNPRICSLTATATPNPIPVGQSTTTISATNLSHTSLSKCKVSGFALPYTVTQTDDSHTYTVACTGDTGYNSCSSNITVTKAGATCSVSLSADKTVVAPNEAVNFTATPTGCLAPVQYTWKIEDPERSKSGYQVTNYSNTLTYSWSQVGTYKAYVTIKDNNDKTARSNDITITVTNTPPPPPTCVPNCTGKECGPDDCGGSCGSCPSGKACADGKCVCSPCQIFYFRLNGKTSSSDKPLIVWVNSQIKGEFSVSASCTSCKVTSNDNWNETYSDQSYVAQVFKITTPGKYSYTLECTDACGENTTDNTSLANVEARYLPFWREIIPNLQGFLRGLIN